MADYTFSDEERQRAMAFGRARAQDSGHYAKRGNNPEKVYVDVTNGALAEIAVYHALRKMLPKASVPPPDLTYHNVKKKSWDPDFRIRFGKDGNNAVVKGHVKSFLTGRFGGNIKDSFMFQKGTGNHADRDISLIRRGGNATDLFIPVVNKLQDYEKGVIDSVDLYAIADCCTVYGPFGMQDIVDKNLWKPPKKTCLRATKRVLYLDDIFKNIAVVENITFV